MKIISTLREFFNTLKEFLRGLKNNVFSHFNPLWKQRRTICRQCPLNQNGICNKNLWLNDKYIDNPAKENNVYNAYMIKRISLKKHKLSSLSSVKINNKVYRRGCGCILFIKQKSNSSCPLKFW